MNAFETLLDQIVLVKTRAGKTSSGRLIALHGCFAEFEHRNGARSLIAYDQIAEMAEIPYGGRA